MEIEELWERVDRLGWRNVEGAAWRWAHLTFLAGRVGLADQVETELVTNGVEGLELMWSLGLLSDGDMSAIVEMAYDRTANQGRELSAV